MQAITTAVLLLNNTKPQQYNSDQLTYAASAIQELIRYQGGHCVFLDFGGEYYYDNFLNEILLHPRMAMVSRVVLSGQLQNLDPGGRYPSILLVEGKTKKREQYSWISDLFFYKIDHNTRTILFAPNTSSMDVTFQLALLEVFRFHMVAVVPTDERRVFYKKWMAANLVELPYPPPVEELFRYQMKDSAQHYFTYSLRRRSLDQYRSQRAPIGAGIRWANETAKFLNGTSIYLRHNCHEHSKVWSTCYRKFLLEHNISYSIEGAVLADSELQFAWRMLPLSFPQSAVLLVPRSELLQRRDLLGTVLQTYPAIAISAIILITELIVLFMQIFSAGDPLLYALCATPPYDLRFGKFFEKYLLVSVMLAVVIITHEYRALLDALAICRPFQVDVNSLDELHASEMKITADLTQFPELRDDPRFNERILHDSVTQHRLDGKHAYIMDSELAELLLGMKINYDHRYGRWRYRNIGSTINVNVQYRILVQMEPFYAQFAYTEKVFFESGIWQHWTREHRWLMDGELWTKLGGEMRSDDRVGIWLVEDLQVAWMTLAIGFTVGFIVLLLDFAFYWF